MTKGHNKQLKPEISEKGKQDGLKHGKRTDQKGGRTSKDESNGKKGANSI